MVSFKQELIHSIELSGHSTEDVLFISAVKYSFDEYGDRDGEELVELNPEYIFNEMEDFFYNNGYGSPQINTTMEVVFNDGSWLERGEYDGSEWWEFKTAPVRPNTVCNDVDVFFKRDSEYITWW